MQHVGEIALIILIGVIVIAFLVFIWKSGLSFRETQTACHQFQREMQANTSEAFAKLSETMDRTTEALTRNSEILKAVESHQSRPSGSVRT